MMVPLGEDAPADTPVTVALSVSDVPEAMVPGLLSVSDVLVVISTGWIVTVTPLDVDARK